MYRDKGNHSAEASRRPARQKDDWPNDVLALRGETRVLAPLLLTQSLTERATIFRLQRRSSDSLLAVPHPRNLGIPHLPLELEDAYIGR